LRHCRKPPYQVLATARLDAQTISHLYWLGECVEAFHNNRYFPSLFAYLRGQGEDIVTFFEQLLTVCRARNFFALSATQILLLELLLESTGHRVDRDLIRELLLYDWLRCGNRFTPTFIQTADQNNLRKKLNRSMGQSMLPLYDYRSRDEFFRKTTFAEFSGAAIKHLGLAVDGKQAGVVCFLPEKGISVHSHLKTCLLA
jgi:hypothetical protein